MPDADRRLAALDTLCRAHNHVAAQYAHSMERREASAHFHARAILLRAFFATCDEAEAIYG
jgi:hypothetical protein